MAWYGWLLLTLLIVVAAAWIIRELILRSNKKTAKLQIERLERELERKEIALEESKKAQIKAETIIMKKRLEELENNHQEELKKLSAEEKEKYEELRKNPQLGVDYILDLLGSSNSG